MIKEILDAFKNVSDTQLTIEPLSVTDRSFSQININSNILLFNCFVFFHLHALNEIKQ